MVRQNEVIQIIIIKLKQAGARYDKESLIYLKELRIVLEFLAPTAYETPCIHD